MQDDLECNIIEEEFLRDLLERFGRLISAHHRCATSLHGKGKLK